MSIAYLGERFDVHTGGVDLAFPHHEDEIAQSEGALGHPVVSMWVHGDHLLFSGQKMAKSSGNVWTLDRLEEEGHHPLDFRYLCLTSRYRRQLRFSPDALAAAGKARARLAAHLADWGDPTGAPEGPAAKEWDMRFRDAVLDDLDFPRALTVVWGLVGDEAGNFDWEKRFVLVNDARTNDCGYPSSVLLKDGRILTVQCHPEELVFSNQWSPLLFRAFVRAAATGDPIGGGPVGAKGDARVAPTPS